MYNERKLLKLYELFELYIGIRKAGNIRQSLNQ